MDLLNYNFNLSSVHIIEFYFLVISTAVIFLGVLINLFENYLPAFILKTFRCGKHAYKGVTNFPTIEFPKSSFKQFYQVGLVAAILTYPLVVATYIFHLKVPSFFSILLFHCSGAQQHVARVSATNIFVAMTLITLQIARRFYDTHFISIFGRNSKINLTHWIVGITYYPMVILAILCEAPNFTTDESERADLFNLGILEICGVLLFFWSWWHQHVCTIILANLRKTKKGNSSDYKLPIGDWFEYVSSPHCSAEILMYVALTILLWKSSTWGYVMLWVFSNQIESILLSHWWYQETFKNFPKNRKALIPYIY
ncbi:polyprenol reductase [Coccinella septempunctata]|uniref:polyprenol reductase n=1 Tax=Coccinella septempunctata TaxID=41139 RepID=UPI001D0713E9|nr:polyprenol reductase [Coccinella septempunctata]